MDQNDDTHPTISTKEELLRRLREHPAPRSAATLEPGRVLSMDTRRQVDEENRKRIAVLRDRLEKAALEVETQQVFARLGGYAKSNFSNERE